MNERRDILKSILSIPLLAFRPRAVVCDVVTPLKAIKGKPFVMEAVMNLRRGIGWDGLPQLAEVLLDTKDKDDLVLTNIEEIYYFTRC